MRVLVSACIAGWLACAPSVGTGQVSIITGPEPVVSVERRFPVGAPLFVGNAEAFRPVPLVQGLPLIQTKGVVKGDGRYLYIADTGKDGQHNETAKIWKFDPVTKELKVFYQGPLLVNSKWLFFNTKNKQRPSELIVSDYGEEPTPRQPGNGRGAKVFAIPVDEKGDALTPRILHEGPPLRSPEGVTVVGDSVVLADWAAGPETTLKDRPGRFNQGRVFVIPLGGGAPQPLFEDHVWVTLIGSCRYIGEDGRLYIRFIDMDSGRPEQPPILPQSGTAEFWRTRVISETPLKLGSLERVILREDVPVSVKLEGVEKGDEILVTAGEGSRFPGGGTVRKFTSEALDSQGNLIFSLESDTSATHVEVTLQVIRNGKVIATQKISKQKSLAPFVPYNNKHAGAKQMGAINQPRLAATADGTTQGLYLVPANGGMLTTLWRGAPLVEPMGVQYSWDHTKLWITDQSAGPDRTAAIFEVRLPSVAEQFRRYPEFKRQRQLPIQ